MKNVAIKCLSIEHGAKIIKWLNSQGVDTQTCEGNCVGEYYGYKDGLFFIKDQYYLGEDVSIILLPEEDFVLPEKWFIKTTEESNDIVCDWYDKIKNCKTNRSIGNYYCGDDYRVQGYMYWLDLKIHMIKHYTEITFEQFKKYVLKENMETIKRKITPQQGQQIINIACNEWKQKLAGVWGKSIVLGNDIEISEEDYVKMRHACTQEQHELFDVIFGKDIADGTPCLVCDQNNGGDWVLRYSTGHKNMFYNRGEKSGSDHVFWEKYVVLDINNLPVNK